MSFAGSRENRPGGVTFIVATRNRPAEIGRLFESLEAQTVPPVEVVVVDSGTRGWTDAEYAAVRRVPVRVLRTDRPSAAGQRNLGLDAVPPGRELIGFVDDDAVLEPDALEAMGAFWRNAGPDVAGAAFNMTNHPAPGLAGLKSGRISRALGLYGDRPGAVGRSGFQAMIGVVRRDTFVQWLPTGAVVWRAAALAGRRFDEWFSRYSYLEDVDFSYPLGKRYRLAVVAAARYRHLPPPTDRATPFWFGTREVLNRAHFVRKHPELSPASCLAALAVRAMMSFGSALRRPGRGFGLRAAGNLAGLAGLVIGARTGGDVPRRGAADRPRRAEETSTCLE